MPFPKTNPSLERALADRGYNDPTPVQAAVLQPDALDRDLLVSAQTGSGKTVAYGLAIVSTLLDDAAGIPGIRERSPPLVAPRRLDAPGVQFDCNLGRNAGLAKLDFGHFGG
jgi:ATP-dependent RNA helicase DeaD